MRLKAYQQLAAVSLMLVLAYSAAARHIEDGGGGLGIIGMRQGELIVFEGDSLTYGLDASPTGGRKPINGNGLPRSSKPFPELVGSLLDDKVRIENRGYPGDRAADGISRWQGFPKASVLFVMYGTNDFGNFGHSSQGVVPIERYRSDLEALIKQHAGTQTRVILMLPPPLKDPTANSKLEAYRETASALAERLKIPVFDSAAALTGISERWTDGLHLSTQANTALAEAIVKHVVITP